MAVVYCVTVDRMVDVTTGATVLIGVFNAFSIWFDLLFGGVVKMLEFVTVLLFIAVGIVVVAVVVIGCII